MPKGDGPISIAMKSVGLMWTIVLGKRGFDYAWDSALVKVPVLKLWLSAKGDLERIENRRSVALAKLKAANPLTWFKNTAAKAWRAVAGAPRKDLSSLKECQDSF
jgi:ABC-type phosphate transport system auxiliary subunit